MRFSGEIKTTLALAPSCLAAPAKCISHEERISIKNTTSPDKSSFSSQSSGIG